MPQLDFIIIFPQIFWLILTFFSFYVVITHFFLPLFIKVLKARKQIVLLNNQTFLNTHYKFINKQNDFNKLFLKNFMDVKHMLNLNILNYIFKMISFDLTATDKKIITFLYFNLLHYDLNILKTVLLKPTIF